VEIVNLTLNVIIIIGFGVVYVLAKSYLPGYAKEKGKNLATKEDIEAITEKVESIKAQHAESLETVKSKLQLESALKSAFQQKCLEAIIAINELLVEMTLYCWKNMAEQSPSEHYVWSNVDEVDSSKNFHYYRVAVDKAILEQGLYLTNDAKDHLGILEKTIGQLSIMELALQTDDPHPSVVDSARGAYYNGVRAVEVCQKGLMTELGLGNVG
tara:strand:- start:1499 stop:2137 length:639 start_codon:yes stop_codon:yes gene_type:complete